MTMSMYSSYTPEDFNNIEEDIFGERGKTYRFQVPIYFLCSYARSTGRRPTLSFTLQIYKCLTLEYCMLQGLIILSIGHSTFEIYLTL